MRRPSVERQRQTAKELRASRPWPGLTHVMEHGLPGFPAPILREPPPAEYERVAPDDGEWEGAA